ncbi:MAG: hypothetical protein WD333_06660 [Dehalococcoidia bacterium]
MVEVRYVLAGYLMFATLFGAVTALVLVPSIMFVAKSVFRASERPVEESATIFRWSFRSALIASVAAGLGLALLVRDPFE